MKTKISLQRRSDDAYLLRFGLWLSLFGVIGLFSVRNLDSWFWQRMFLVATVAPVPILFAVVISRLLEKKDEALETLIPLMNRKSLLRCLSLAGYLFHREYRERVWEFCVADFVSDYAAARKRHRSKGARWWLNFVFTCRAVLLVITAFKGAAWARVVRAVISLFRSPTSGQ